MDIIKKSQEWAAQYGSLLSASATTRFPTLYKGAVGGLEHVVSVDNGASYFELWRDGTGSYYATTGAAIKQMPGLAKGAALDEALDKFFALTAKLAKGVKKGKTYRDRQGVTQPSARKRSPFKKNVTDDPNVGPYGGPKPRLRKHDAPGHPSGETVRVGALGQKLTSVPHDVAHAREAFAGPPYNLPQRKARKGIVEKVDPEIGPSFSVGHIKPSDLSPESSVSKMARMVIAEVNKWSPGPPRRSTTSGPQMGGQAHGSKKTQHSHGTAGTTHTHPRGAHVPIAPKIAKAALHHAFGDAQTPVSKPKFAPGEEAWAEAAKRDIPPMQEAMGPRPPKGSLRYRRPRIAQKDIVGLSGGMGKPPRVKPGFGDPARVNKPVGRAPRLITNQDLFGRRTTGRRAPYVGSRPVGLGKGRKLDDIEGGRASPSGQITPVKPSLGGAGQPSSYGSTGQPQYSYKRAARKARGPVFQPKKPPQTYQSPQGFSGRRMGAPAAPGAARSGAARTGGRFGKACSPCREVAKAVAEVKKVVATSSGVQKRK